MSSNQASHIDQMVADYEMVTRSNTGRSPVDIHPLMTEMRNKCPVMHGDIQQQHGTPSQADYTLSGRPVVTLFRYNDVHTVLKNAKDWENHLFGDGFGDAVDNLLIVAMDGEEHAKLRATLLKPFTRGEVRKQMDSMIRPVVMDEFLAKMRPKGKADLVREFALPFPIRSAYAYFGFPDDEELSSNLASWAIQVVGAPQVDPELAAITVPRSMVAGQAMYDAILPVVQAYRQRGEMRQDIIGHLMQVEHDGSRFTDDQISSLVRSLLLAAGETTTRSFANMMVQLLEHPDVLDEVRQDRSLIPKAVLETLRRDPSTASIARIAARDLEIGGHSIPKGTGILCAVASANRDPEVYEDPDRLWIKRPMRPLLTFGFGPHMCLGMNLALAELEVALDAMLDLPNLRLDPAYPRPVIRGMNLRGPDAVHVLWD
ncbi:cytochrome P450 [Novosphingobium cyanobacteriorum]|uniref:Cytochrome P450 n=1 Tax=Novosphingobium cyanobacteriorum TaxID=3024215 RepID=A0ABT6CR08_9SPHN|nr:cytochrome P450 [Novosphingobium cyanobacteriorum]MDF8334922.1 cytochrome P450 [Novosphingobium cyanobacteriorum]